MSDIKLTTLSYWITDTIEQMKTYGNVNTDLSNVTVSVNKIQDKQVFNLKLNGNIISSKVW